MNFLYLKIPMAKSPADHTHEIEDKVDQLLRDGGLGAVAGWGDSLGDVLADGTRQVAFARIDVDVTDLPAALALLQANLASFGAPSGTEIHWTDQQQRHKHLLVGSAWVPGQIA